MNKQLAIFIACVVLEAAAIGAALLIDHVERGNAPQAPQPTEAPEGEAPEAQAPEEGEAEIENEHTTNVIGYFEGEMPPADPLMVGRWKEIEKNGWHKVYYDDDDGEGRYWGKEWDEADDVLEEDLSYHGNGWFRWTKSNDTLYEYSTMDFRDVPIAHIYLITVFDSVNIAMAESNGRSTYNFIKE